MKWSRKLRRYVYKTTPARRAIVRAYHEGNAALGLCINGPKHGPATHGKRCERCATVHRKSA